MYDVEAMRADQRPGQATLPDLGIEMTDSAHREHRQSIRHQFSDFVAPYVHQAIGNEMQAFKVMWKCVTQFLPRSFMHKEMHINTHLPQVLKILKRNERFATEDADACSATSNIFSDSFSTDLGHW